MRQTARGRGFTIIELLIVVAVIGIVAAILIPNLLDAVNKAKQKRTVAEIREIGTGWMSWLTDQVGAASAGSQAKMYDGTQLSPITYSTLYDYLHPTDTFFYLQEVPQLDGWLYELEFGLNDDLLEAAVILICSPGRDGQWERGGCAGLDHPVGPFIATNYEADTIWADGYMVRWPGAIR